MGNFPIMGGSQVCCTYRHIIMMFHEVRLLHLPTCSSAAEFILFSLLCTIYTSYYYLITNTWISLVCRMYLVASEENVGSKSEEDLYDLFMTFPGCLHDWSPSSLDNYNSSGSLRCAIVFRCNCVNRQHNCTQEK